MPATRPHRLNNPLRKLRLILGDGENALDQESFADRAGLSLATVRAIEAGRRPLNEYCLTQIQVTLLATWDSIERKWCLLNNRDVPYEKQYASFAELFDPQDSYVDDLYVHRLVERLLIMFSNCPSRQARFGLLLYLSDFLKECAAGFGIPDRELKTTEPFWFQARNRLPDASLKVCGKPLPEDKKIVFVARYKDVRGDWRWVPHPHKDRGGIFDFRAWRTFIETDYPPADMDDIPQMITPDTRPDAKEDEILSAPIAHPNAENEKIVLEMELPEEP